MSRQRLLIIAAMMLARPVSAGQMAAPVQDPVISQLQPFTPQVVLDLTKPPRKVRIQYTRADLEGTGKFDFIVAAYLAPVGGKIRVLRALNGSLQLAADLDPGKQLDTSGTVALDIVDIAQTGKPQIVVKSYGSHTQYDVDVLTWTGTSLHSLFPAGGSFENAQLIDLDGDGVLEIVTPPSCQESSDPNEICNHTFRVYKFNGTQYVLAFTSPIDPTGQISSTGDAQNVYGQARIKPNQFSMDQVQGAREKYVSDEGEVTLRLGNLSAPVDNNPGPRTLNELDLKSLVLGRNIHALKARLIQSHEDDPDDQAENVGPSQSAKQSGESRFEGPFVQAKFSRQSILEFLPRTQLNKPLAPGDVLTLDVRAKMKNGAPVFSSVTVKIVGDHDEHKGKD